jgi:hypothetical protein
MNKVLNFIMGCVFFILGLGVLVNPIFYSSTYRTNIDLSNVKWLFSVISCAFGVVFMRLAFSRKLGQSCYWICPKCEEVYLLKKNKESMDCEHCGHRLEILEGFYDRKK